MRDELQPETLTTLDDPANQHVDFDNTTGCEGGARSSGQGSSTTLEMEAEEKPPLDERIRDMVRKVLGETPL